jgi:hypothetical protein
VVVVVMGPRMRVVDPTDPSNEFCSHCPTLAHVRPSHRKPAAALAGLSRYSPHAAPCTERRKPCLCQVCAASACARVPFRYRTVALRDRGRCQPTVVSLTNDRSALRHVLACLGLGFPAKSVPEQANRDCTSPVTESC